MYNFIYINCIYYIELYSIYYNRVYNCIILWAIGYNTDRSIQLQDCNNNNTLNLFDFLQFSQKCDFSRRLIN